MTFCEGLFEFIEKYLNASSKWNHSHISSIGDIEKSSPWREDVWRSGTGWTVIHWENVLTPPHMSFHSPRHVWKLSYNDGGWVLSLTFGVAPFAK